MIDKYQAEEGAEQEVSFDNDASAEAQEKYFRCIICRSNVHRLRYVRSNPIVVLCKPEAPFTLNVLHRGVFNSLRCPITSSRSTMSSSFRLG
ncbi:unnamed protein product [Angiostrongylus costaricensis]|uniref:Zf-C3HC4 domain-containing protein n=1 Tax=Angiostrongylus costaricensis TaxID=334426 RepID=A0A0R3Q1Q4_ANGCS|nr:unnamed protein product [Angiostrongylus costaricensis]